MRAIVAALNVMADAELDKLRATHAELTAQLLRCRPSVLPRLRGEGPRAGRQRNEAR